MPVSIQTPGVGMRLGIIKDPPAAQPFNALSLAGEWWFDRLGVPDIIPRRNRRQRNRFVAVFRKEYQLPLEDTLTRAQGGEKASPLLINEERDEQLRRRILSQAGLEDYSWPTGCAMWIYATNGEVSVVAYGPNDPFQQCVYPKITRVS